jgi:hypothetical protein
MDRRAAAGVQARRDENAGAVAFSEVFALSLHLQDVLHYSALRSGVAFTGFAVTVVVVSNLAQALVEPCRRATDGRGLDERLPRRAPGDRGVQPVERNSSAGGSRRISSASASAPHR